MCKAHTLSTVSLSPDARPGQNEGVKEGRARWPETVGDCIRSFAFFLFQGKKKIKKSYCIVGACAGVRRERDPHFQSPACVRRCASCVFRHKKGGGGEKNQYSTCFLSP